MGEGEEGGPITRKHINAAGVAFTMCTKTVWVLGPVLLWHNTAEMSTDASSYCGIGLGRSDTVKWCGWSKDRWMYIL